MPSLFALQPGSFTMKCLFCWLWSNQPELTIKYPSQNPSLSDPALLCIFWIGEEEAAVTKFIAYYSTNTQTRRRWEIDNSILHCLTSPLAPMQGGRILCQPCPVLLSVLHSVIMIISSGLWKDKDDMFQWGQCGIKYAKLPTWCICSIMSQPPMNSPSRYT